MSPKPLFGPLLIAALPLAGIEFESNLGQMRSVYAFSAKGPGVELLGETGGNLTLFRTPHRDAVTIAWLGAKAGHWRQEGPTGRVVRFCVGGAPKEACENGGETSARMRRAALYEGVDLVVHGANGSFEYDLELQPGADFEAIRFEFRGDATPYLDPAGRILAGDIVQWRPVAWQTQGKRRYPVDCAVRQISAREFAFSISGPYRKDLPLTIDPVIEMARAIIGPERGEDKILGGAAGYSFGVSRRAGTDHWDVFVTYNPNRSGWTTTYWGGDGDEHVLGFSADSNNQTITLTGSTSSRNARTIGPGVISSYQGGASDGFFLTLAGGTLQSATLAGGPGADRIFGVSGILSIPFNSSQTLIGETDNPNWNGYTVNGEARGGFDAIAVSYQRGGGALLVWGGSGDDSARIIRSVPGSPPYVLIAGETESPDFPGKSTPGKDLWFARFSASPFRIETPRIWGGEGDESLAGFEVIPGHGLMLAGTTNSTRLPGVPADRPGYNGGTSDGFAAWLDPTDYTTIQARYLGGPGGDGILSMTIRQNDLFLAGYTDSAQLALPDLMPGSDPGGLEDGLFIQTDALLNPITAYRAGGSGNERFTSIQPLELGRVELSGWSESRPWLASLDSSLPEGSAVGGFSYFLRYAVTSAQEANTENAPPILTLGRDLRLELAVNAHNEPASDGILMVRSLDPTKLLVNGGPSVLLAQTGGQQRQQAIAVEALAEEGEVDLVITGRTPTATPIHYPERRIRVRLVPSKVFFTGADRSIGTIRRGLDFRVGVQLAQLLPNGAAGTPRNLRQGVPPQIRIVSSDLSIAAPNGAQMEMLGIGLYYAAFRAIREGTVSFSIESSFPSPAPDQRQRVQITETDIRQPRWASLRALAVHHVGSLYFDLAAGDRLQLTAENPERVPIGLTREPSGNRVTIADRAVHQVFFGALQAGAAAGIRIEGMIGGSVVNERFEVIPLAYAIRRSSGFGAFSVIPGTPIFLQFEIHAVSPPPGAVQFESWTIAPNSPPARAPLVYSAPGIVVEASRTITGGNLSIGLRAVGTGRTTVALEDESLSDAYTIEIVSPRIRFESPLIVPAGSRAVITPTELFLPSRSMQALRLRVSDPQLFGLEWERFRGAEVTVNFSLLFQIGLEAKGPPGSEGFLIVSAPDIEEFTVPIKVAEKVLLPRIREAQALFFSNESPARGYLFYSLAAFDPSASIANGKYRTMHDLGDSAGQKITVKTTPEGICTLPAEATRNRSGLDLEFVCTREGTVKVDLQGAGLSGEQANLTVSLTASRNTSPTALRAASGPISLALGTQASLALQVDGGPQSSPFSGRVSSTDPERVRLSTSAARLGTGEVAFTNWQPIIVQGFGDSGVVWLKAESTTGLRAEIPVFLYPATMAIRTQGSPPQGAITVSADSTSLVASAAPYAVEPTSGFIIPGSPLALRAGIDPFFVKTKTSDDRVASSVPPDLLFSESESARDTSFKINGAGSASLLAEQPPSFVEARDGALRLTVVERELGLAAVALAPGLQSFGRITVSGPTSANAGQQPLTLTSLDPTKLLLSADGNTMGAPTLAIRIGGSFLLQVSRTARPGEKLRVQLSAPGFQGSVAELAVSDAALTWESPPRSNLFPGSSESYFLRYSPVNPFDPALPDNTWNGLLAPGEAVRLSVRAVDPSIASAPATVEVSNSARAQFQLRALRPGSTELVIEAPAEVSNRVGSTPIRVGLWELGATLSGPGARGLWSPFTIVNPRNEPVVVTVSGTGAGFALSSASVAVNTLQVPVPAASRTNLFWTGTGNTNSGEARLSAPEFANQILTSGVSDSQLNFPPGALQTNLPARTATVALRLTSNGIEKPLALAPIQVEVRSSDSRVVRIASTPVELKTGQSTATVNLEFVSAGTAVLTATNPAALGQNAVTTSMTVVVR